MPRQRLSLRPNSIPSIFAGCADKSQKALADRSPNLPSVLLCNSPASISVPARPYDPLTSTPALPYVSRTGTPVSALSCVSPKTFSVSTQTCDSPTTFPEMFSVSIQTCDSPTTFPEMFSVSTPPCDSPRTFPVSTLVDEKMDCSTNDDLESGNNPSTGNAGTATLYTTTELLRDWTSLPITDRIASWGVFPSNVGLLFMSCNVPVSDSSYATSRTLLVKMDMTVEVKARYRPVRFPALQRVTCLQDVLSALKAISSLQVCEGPSCKNVLFERKSTARCNRCNACQVKHRQEQDRERKRRKRELARTARALQQTKFKKNMKRKLTRAQMAVERYKADLQICQAECESKNEEVLNESIKYCSKEMQEAIKACWRKAKCKDSRAMRYSKEWILECLLLKIKSRRTYLHLRKHNILAVPTIETLNKYIQNFQPSVGFDPEVFAMLKKKAASMKPEDRRGTLVNDEMALSEGMSFDETTLTNFGFVDLGKHTPKSHENERANEALVFLFQPFRGKWIQNVAAFLSKGCASSEPLHNLTLECIILLEQSGFYVDVVTSDGAQWNRAMWKRFGLLDDSDLTACCAHPCDSNEDEHEHDPEDCNDPLETRRLWFCSDFSHLIKNFRNFFIQNDVTWTPDGEIKLKHFRAVIRCDGGPKHLGMKIAYKLTPDHLNPKYYQKMSVPLAVELFSPNVAAAMRAYRDMGEEDLQDCESTVSFINRIHSLIVAMSSRSSENSLSIGSRSYETIMNVRAYLKEWERTAKEQHNAFMSSNTIYGFHITLRSAIEVMTFLTEKCGYSFLMTARLNQDVLEGMFGMIRGCCGSTDKPDPLLFMRIYRFVSFYSLVQPPKGSNIQAVEIFETLLTTKQSPKSNENKDEWAKILDAIVKNGEEKPPTNSAEHCYDYIEQVNPYVQAYFSGFVARKISCWTDCEKCLAAVTKSTGNSPRDIMIDSLSRGSLKYPSDSLFDLLAKLESVIVETVGFENLQMFTFLHIGKNILAEGGISSVGCVLHSEALTRKVINYYLVTRSKILCKQFNKVYSVARKKEQEFRKKSKLVSSMENPAKNTKDTIVNKVPHEKKDRKDKNAKEQRQPDNIQL